MSSDTRFHVGQQVEVAPRTWAGINKPGGVCIVEKVHFTNGYIDCLDVKYVLDNSTEARIDTDFLSPYQPLERQGRSRRRNQVMNIKQEKITKQQRKKQPMMVNKTAEEQPQEPHLLPEEPLSDATVVSSNQEKEEKDPPPPCEAIAVQMNHADCISPLPVPDVTTILVVPQPPKRKSNENTTSSSNKKKQKTITKGKSKEEDKTRSRTTKKKKKAPKTLKPAASKPNAAPTATAAASRPSDSSKPKAAPAKTSAASMSRDSKPKAAPAKRAASKPKPALKTEAPGPSATTLARGLDQPPSMTLAPQPFVSLAPRTTILAPRSSKPASKVTPTERVPFQEVYDNERKSAEQFVTTLMADKQTKKLVVVKPSARDATMMDERRRERFVGVFSEFLRRKDGEVDAAVVLDQVNEIMGGEDAFTPNEVDIGLKYLSDCDKIMCCDDKIYSL